MKKQIGRKPSYLKELFNSFDQSRKIGVYSSRVSHVNLEIFGCSVTYAVEFFTHQTNPNISRHNQLYIQWRIKGGGHFGQVPGAPRFRGAPQIFWASRLFMAPCFSGPHRMVLGGHIIRVWCIGALGPHVLISNMNRVPFCVFSCKRQLRMRKIGFQRFQISKIFGGEPPNHCCCSCCDQGHDNDNITQLCYLNSESREETDQKIFVAKTDIYSIRQLCLEQIVFVNVALNFQTHGVIISNF